MPQLPEDSAKQMTVSRLEKARGIWSYIKLARSCHFPPVLLSLYPREAPNLEVLSGYREEVLRKTLSFWSEEQEKKDKGQRKKFCFVFSFPLPCPGVIPLVAAAKKQWQCPPGRRLKPEKQNSSRPEELRPYEHAVIPPYPLTAWCEFTKKR